MCFAPQRRAIFGHLNFKSERRWGVLHSLTWKCASHHSGVQFLGVLHSLTWKCASRYSGVQFLDIWTSKSEPPLRCFVHFDLKMCFSLQRRAIFHFSSKQLPPQSSAPAALPSLLFDPADPQIIDKTQHFATSLTFRTCWSSFYWLSRNCIFFLLTLLLCFFIFWLCYSALLFQLSILSEVRLLNFLW